MHPGFARDNLVNLPFCTEEKHHFVGRSLVAHSFPDVPGETFITTKKYSIHESAKPVRLPVSTQPCFFGRLNRFRLTGCQCNCFIFSFWYPVMNGTLGNASSQFPIRTTTYSGPNPNNICCSFIPSTPRRKTHNGFAGDGVRKNQRIVAAVHIQPSHFWATLPVKALNVIKCVPYSVVIVKWSVLICKEPKLTSANSATKDWPGLSGTASSTNYNT